jgi:cation diffusion facilitator family transporter
MEEKFKNIKKAGILGIFGNLFLLIIKASIGFISRSQAMIADSINSASDILSSLMTFIGNKISSEPEDNSHNFGHGKAEYIFSLFISITMIGVSIKLLIDSIESLILKSKFEFSIWLVIVCITTIITKFCLFLYTNSMYKKYDNILLKANSQDHRNDCIVTTFTLISVLLSLVNIYWFDGVVGIGISIWIFISGLKIFVESYNVLMDISLDETTKETIMEIVKSHDNIIDITNLYAIPIGYNYVVIFTISVDGNMTTFESHKLADHLENEISNFDKIDKTIIHVNPV